MHLVTPDSLRELAYMIETGLDVVSLVERMAATSDEDLPVIRKEMEAKLRAAHLDPGALVVAAGWMATVALQMRKELGEAERLLKPSNYEYEKPADVLEFRR